MSLLIPREFLRDVNPFSGYFNAKSKFRNKNLKGLFRSPENREYLAKTLFQLITHPGYVRQNLEPSTEMNHNYHSHTIKTPFSANEVLRRIKAFSSAKPMLDKNMEDLIEMMPLPYKEDIIVSNPIQQLHALNKEFLLKTSKNMIQCPEMLVPRFFSINPETGEDESNIEYDYTSESYSQGVWKPEDLFLNSQRNKDNPYWVPLEVNYYSNADSTGPGHRYYSKQYSTTVRTRSQFPRWQTSVEDVDIEPNINEALREGGSSDRRTQWTRGYNMGKLLSKSTY